MSQVAVYAGAAAPHGDAVLITGAAATLTGGFLALVGLMRIEDRQAVAAFGVVLLTYGSLAGYWEQGYQSGESIYLLGLGLLAMFTIVYAGGRLVRRVDPPHLPEPDPEGDGKEPVEPGGNRKVDDRPSGEHRLTVSPRTPIAPSNTKRHATRVPLTTVMVAASAGLVGGAFAAVLVRRR